eukprot:gene11287-5232_t
MQGIGISTSVELAKNPHPSVHGSASADADGVAASAIILVSGFVGIAFAIFQFMLLAKTPVPEPVNEGAGERLMNAGPEKRLGTLYGFVRDGANSFLKAEYILCFIFIVVFGVIVLILTSHIEKEEGGSKWDWAVGALTMCSFAVGGTTSIVSGFIGMTVATFGNARCTIAAAEGHKELADKNTPAASQWRGAFNAAFRAGSVMGFALCGLSLLVLFLLITLFKA